VNRIGQEKLVLDVLEDVANNGVAHEQLESVLHQLEISQREIGGDGYPYGLQLILGGMTAAIHRSDPAALLNLDPVIDSLRQQIKDPEFIKSLVRENLLDKQHRVRLTLRPDTELSRRKDQAEQSRLAMIKAAMSDDEKNAVIKRAHALEQRQQQADDPEILPKVTLEDVPPEVVVPESTSQKIAGVDSTLYAQGTNGLVYHEMVLDLPEMTTEQLNLLPHFSSCLTELGCADKDYLSMQRLQSSVCGDIHGHASILAKIDDVQTARGYFLVSGKALNRNNTRLAELMHETINAVRFDEHDRIKDIISQKRARKEQSVTGNGHTLAMTAASSGMSSVAALNHHFNGLEGIRFLKKIDEANNKSIDAVSEMASGFSELHKLIITSPHQYMLTAEEKKLKALVSEFETVWKDQASGNSFKAFALDKVEKQVKQMWVANTQINFCARAYPTVPVEHEDAAVLSVLGGFLRNGFLHTAIREQGGAYGGGANHDANIAAFRFYSYRDPRLEETLDDFDRSIDWMLNNNHQWRQVEEAILGVIGAMDKPVSPAGEARHAFHNQLHGRTKEKLQTHRQRVLAVTLDDLKRVTEKYLKADRASTAVITSAATLEQRGELGMEVYEL
jgi:Zn-dependent M16 (insulinase) family peptidase